jgi:hypothetical protein
MNDPAAVKLRPRDVIDVLAALPPDALAALLARTQRRLAQAEAEVVRLQHEGFQIDAALKAKQAATTAAVHEETSA